jgi:photosystem II stability/assembly factor-like uncharacterized protein
LSPIDPILHTTDGGATWIRQFSPSTEALRGISLVNGSTGTAIGSRGTILRTNTGGD